MSINRSSARNPTAALIAVLAAVTSGCDRDPVELLDEINTIRSECTEEMLKNADEACVQMFERYAEMGEDALETYVGGVRAFDEALRRRGGLQFDTTGLGRPFTDTLWRAAPGATSPGSSVGARRLNDEPFLSPSDRDPLERNADQGWRSAADREPAVDRREPARSADPAFSTAPRREAVEPAPRPRRGVLLPPEDRLRRPWIGDDGEPAPYVEDETRRDRVGDDDRRSRESGDPGQWTDGPPQSLDPRYDGITPPSGRWRSTPGT